MNSSYESGSHPYKHQLGPDPIPYTAYAPATVKKKKNETM